MMLTLRVSWVVSLASEGAKIALGSVAAADFHVGHYGLGDLGKLGKLGKTSKLVAWE